LPPERLATLRSDVFLSAPAKAIMAAAALFDLRLTAEDADAVAAGPLFQSHSKRPEEGFDQATRKRDEVMVRLAFGPEIEQAIKWGEGVAKEASIPLELEGTLVS